MSQENVELLHQTVNAINRGDIDGALENAADDFEVDWSNAIGPGRRGTHIGYVKEAGLPPIPLKNLRHTHATVALQAGVHPKVVQERLGHATIGITLDTDSQAIPAMQEDAAATVAALIAT
jgi:integrase